MSGLGQMPDRSGDLHPEWTQNQPYSSIYQMICSARDKFAERPGLSFQLTADPNGKRETLTYQELVGQIIQAANLFRSLGVGPDDVVAMILPNTNESVFTIFGAMIAGKIAPINPLLEPEKIASLLREINAKVVVTLAPFPKIDIAQKAHLAVSLAPCVAQILEISLERYAPENKEDLARIVQPQSDLAHQATVISFHDAISTQSDKRITFSDITTDRVIALFHTGGTTGAPKIAQHTVSGFLYQAWPLMQDKVVVEGDVMMCPLPLFHVMASNIILNVSLQAGANFVTITPWGYRGPDVFDNFWKLIERYRATCLVVVPTAAAALLQRQIDDDISSLRVALSGSAPLPAEVFNQFQKITGMRILEGYGMTETTGLSSLNPINGIQKPGSVGLPQTLTEVRILQIDTSGMVTKECDTNETGEICISSPGVNLGNTYLKPEMNNSLYVLKHYLRSGDLGLKDEDGYIWITGRAKDLIIRGGHNIDPREIEEALLQHSAVALAAAIGQPDRYAGEIPYAYVKLLEGAAATSQELMNFAAAHIRERAAVPRQIEIVGEMPLTSIGKVFKPALRQMAARRAFDTALQEAGLTCRVADVIADQTLGMLIRLRGRDNVDEALVTECLGSFATRWSWIEDSTGSEN